MNLPDALFEEVRSRAAATGRTTTSVVVEALRMFLDAPPPEGRPQRLPSYGRRNGRFLVDIEDRDALWSALDEDK